MPLKKKRLLKREDIVKSLKGFVKDEDGFVSKDTILRVGLAAVAGMAALGSVTSASAQEHTNHANSVGQGSDATVEGGSCCFQHSNTVSHGSY